jgi:hypothetical protein
VADTKISALTDGGPALYDDRFPVARTPYGSGDNRRLTTAQLRHYFDVTAYGWIADGTDRSSAMQAVLDAAEAAGGGTIYFPPSTGVYRADSQMLIPNDADTPQAIQVNIALEGAGGGANWYVGVGAPMASVLDLRYQGEGAKITSLGLGALRIANLQITDGGAVNGTPFVLSTNTTLKVRECSFLGGGAKTATVTMTIASPCVVTWAGHGLQANNTIHFTNSGGALPTGITASELYYVSATGLTTDTFQISHNHGTASINTSGSQSGTHTGRFGGVDAIMLGGTDTTSDGSVDDPFQGYGTVIDGNVFSELGRGVVGLNYANGIVVINNSFIHVTGVCGIESDGSSGFGAGQFNHGWMIANNLFEMDVYRYGVKFTATKWCTLGPNGFYDEVAGTSAYRFEAMVGQESTMLSSFNTIIGNYNSQASMPVVTQDGNTAQLTTTSLLSADNNTPMSGATGSVSSEIAYGLVVKGERDDTKQYAGPLNVTDRTDLTKNMSLGYLSSQNSGYIDAYNLGSLVPGFVRINPRGGAVGTAANIRASKTTNYPVTVADSSTQFDNLGASGTVNFTLPSDPSVGSVHGGVIYGFCVAAAQTLQITCGHASATIAVIGLGTTATGGNITCATVGSYIELTNYDTSNGRKWVAKSFTGTWAIN